MSETDAVKALFERAGVDSGIADEVARQMGGLTNGELSRLAGLLTSVAKAVKQAVAQERAKNKGLRNSLELAGGDADAALQDAENVREKSRKLEAENKRLRDALENEPSATAVLLQSNERLRKALEEIAKPFPNEGDSSINVMASLAGHMKNRARKALGETEEVGDVDE